MKANQEKEPLLRFTSPENFDMKTRLKNILIVDDDEISNFVTSNVLEELNLAENIYVYESPKDALRIIEGGNSHELPELIFLDVNMPEMDGFQFIEEYKEHVKTGSNSKIVMYITTQLNAEEEKRAEKYSPYISEFVSKPITPDVVKDILEKHFE